MKIWRDKRSEEPLKRMLEFVNAAQRGDFSITLPVTSSGELGELERGLNRLVEEIRTNRDLWEEQKTLQRELKISRGIQATLLPSSLPQVPAMEIETFYRPAIQIGGDYYDFIEIDTNHLGIAIADVSGKSVSGAMLMTLARNTLRAQAMLTLSPQEVLERTQKLLLPNIMSQFFVSIFYAILDKRFNRLVCANAGHPPLLYFRAEAGECEWVRPKGIAVGLSRNGLRPVSSEEKELSLGPGDLAFFYTDGISDTTDIRGKYFGRDRIAEIAVKSAPRGAKAFLADLQEALASHGGDGPQGDDMTGVVLRRLVAPS